MVKKLTAINGAYFLIVIFEWWAADEACRVTSNQYDALGRFISYTNPANETVHSIRVSVDNTKLKP